GPADHKPQPRKQPKDEPRGRGKEGGFRERAERLAKQFEEWDTDKDGKISKDEAKGKMIPFERMDADKDGFVTRDEFRAFFRAMAQGVMGGEPGKGGGMPTLEERMARFKEMDKNGDGKVT